MTIHRLLFLIYVLCADQILCSEEKSSPIVELKSGKLRGIEETSTEGKRFYSFYGIPFAKPPVGDLRFEEPMKIKKWDGTLEANTMPNECIQLNMFGVIKGTYEVTGQEDCLYLNVFTQTTSSKASLPVMVFIHGGGYVCGSAAMFLPHNLLNEEILLVVIQYRLGVLGFLSTEDSSMPGNIGLKDQRMALQWVQENIRNFGGDPDEVTIFGESAGGGSVHLQMLSPGSKGLFKGVIAQSGAALCPWSNGNAHRNYATTFGEKVGCSLTEDSDSFKKCLKNIDAKSLIFEMGHFFKWGFTPLSTVPRVDGDFIPDHPATLVRTGRYNKVNLIMGVNRDEGIMDVILALFDPKLKKDLVEEFSTIAPLILRVENEPDPASLSKTIFDHYLKGKTLEDQPIDELTAMFSDAAFKVSSDLSALLHVQDSDIKTYLYEFNHRGQRSLTDLFGVASLPNKYVSHADEMFYLFTGGPFFAPLEREEDIELRRKVTKLWTNFANFGNPTPSGSFDFVWNPATSSNFDHLSITTTPAMQSYQRKNTLDFWKTLDTDLNRAMTLHEGKVVLEQKEEL